MFLTFLALRLMDALGSEAGGGAGTSTVSTPNASTASAATSTGSTSTQSPSPSGNPDPTTTPTQSTSTQQTDPNANDPAYGNWKALRDKYTEANTALQAAQTQAQRWTALTTEAQTLAGQLGYSEQELQAAFDYDPIRTLQLLREQASSDTSRQPTAPNQQDPRSIQDLIRKEMEPINSVVNQQITEAAMVKYNTSVTDAIKADPILKDAPEPVHQLVKDYLEESLASQPEIVKSMKFKGDYSAVQQSVTYIAGRLHQAFTDWLNTRNTSGQPLTATNAHAAPVTKKFSLDDIINDPSVLGAQYK